MEYQSILNSTMAGLEAGLQVRHIATFNPTTVSTYDNVDDVLKRDDLADFDYLPVQNRDGRIVGLLERRSGTRAGAVSEAMRSLDEELLVSSDSPLMDFLPEMKSTRCRLAVDGHRIRAIVTRSDVLKLPVRLLTFCLITHLEMVMTKLIRERFTNESEWLDKLSEPRASKIRSEFEERRHSRLDPSHLEFATLCDKRDVLRKTLALESKRKFDNDVDNIEKLRNQVVHASDYITDTDSVVGFIETLQSCRDWITELENHFHGGGSNRSDVA
jgi:hypothetical protein